MPTGCQDPNLSQQSYLFTVRLWVEELGDDQTEWRGKVQSAASGEARYFRDWPGLIAHLRGMLPGTHTHPFQK